MAEMRAVSPAPAQPCRHPKNRSSPSQLVPKFKRDHTLGPEMGGPNGDDPDNRPTKRPPREPFPHRGQLQTRFQSVHLRHPKRPRGEPFPHRGELQTGFQNIHPRHPERPRGDPFPHRGELQTVLQSAHPRHILSGSALPIYVLNRLKCGALVPS